MDSSPHPLIAQTLTGIARDRTDRTVAFEGAELELRYAPEPGVDLRVRCTDPDEPGAGAVSTVFDRAADRPPAYPPELPYLPGAKVSVMALPGRASPAAMWLLLDDVESSLAEIRAQSEAAGWTESTDSEEPLPPGLRMIILTRPGGRRTLIVGSIPDHGTLVLIDKRADE